MSFFDRVLESLEGISGGREEVDEIDDFTKDVEGWYMSGLGYGRDVGAIIYGVTETEAEDILREFLEKNALNYNPRFYGLAEIDYDGSSNLEEVLVVNL